jgi:DNA-binding transcriptional ArsR family regulator
MVGQFRSRLRSTSRITVDETTLQSRSSYYINKRNTPQGGHMQDEQIDAMSKLLKSMSHPIRLKILCLLQDKELSVGEIRDQVKTTNANVSQHLNILRNQGILDYRKDANFIYNKITDKRILELIKKMRVLFCPNF